MTEPTVYEAMSTLRAVRRLKPDPIPTAVLGRVLQAAAWAPTGGNAQPWRIVLVTDPQPKAALGALYSSSWKQFSKVYEKRLAGVPEADRAREQRTLAAGDYLADHFHESPGDRGVLLQPEIHGDHRREARSSFGGRRRLDLYRGAESAARVPRRRSRLRVDDAAVRARGTSARNPRDPTTVGHRRCDPDGLSDGDRPRPDPAAQRQRTRVREPLGHALA